MLSVTSMPAQLTEIGGYRQQQRPTPAYAQSESNIHINNHQSQPLPPHAHSISGISSTNQELMRPPPPVRSVSLFTTNPNSTATLEPTDQSRTGNPQFLQPPLSQAPSLFSDINQTPAVQNNPQNRRRGTFESSATTQEYSVLSSILHGNSTPSNLSLSDVNMTSPAFSDDSTRTDNSNYYHANYLNQFSLGNSPRHNLSEILASVDMNHQPNDWLNDTPRPPPISFTIADTIDNIMDPEFKLLEEQLASNNPPPQSLGGTAAPAQSETAATTLPANYTTATRLNTRLGGFSNTGSWQPTKKPADIYRNVRQPFPYTPGFHALIKYLKSRFDKLQLIQMAKCMARYRPSFIACTNSLDEDDLVFMEQCFQRTLLEYEKYISYSGTPTAIWRRTGQIAAVGKEFCILTGWSRQQLLDRDGSGTGGMFIVEVMQDESVLEYFQMFSDISFGDSQGAMMSECSLLTPNGKTIRASSMWTLKRDVFGIPMMIIGNFLPILS